ncbi:MAG: hypothetical protein P0S95_04750 [Rhabdochlamydiaceae bacterium]|nr:hypothetical protein [Candidatus Amphrikana amoebophyrae]
MKYILTIIVLLQTLSSFADFDKELFEKAKKMALFDPVQSIEVFNEVIEKMTEEELSDHPDVLYSRAIQLSLVEESAFKLQQDEDSDDFSHIKSHFDDEFEYDHGKHDYNEA